MTEPWGISGPQFLWWYFWAVLVAIVVGLLLSKILWRRERPTTPISVEEIAYLGHGRRRVIAVAVARLIESGAVRVQRSGILQATGVPGHTYLDGEILREVASRPQTARDLCWSRQADSPDWIPQQLNARRLLVVDPAARRLTRVLPLLIVLGVGVARMVNGIMLHRPVGSLQALLIFTVAPLGMLTVGNIVIAGRLEKERTARSGDRLLKRLRRGRPVPGMAPLAGAAGLVAIGGLSAYPDPLIATALEMPPLDARALRSSSSSCSASSNNDSSSSGSSGGGGGSSCGG